MSRPREPPGSPKHAFGYQFQHGTDPTNPDAWPPPATVPGCKYKLSGLTLGQKLYFGFAILRNRTLQVAWSDILEVTVREWLWGDVGARSVSPPCA
jgi:hypothetical protein